MSSHEAYLRTSLAKYNHPDTAKRDILTMLHAYKDLRPKLDFFVFNDGARKELLCLDGTIPVGYKGSTYNIPICLWLLDSHPYNPPMVYVKPTSTMQIKPGQHVDSNGKVYLPYLHDWRHPQSDLLGLTQVLAIVFSETPPVFSRGAAPPRPTQPPRPGGAPAGNLPYPSQAGGMPTPYPPAAGANPSFGAGYPPATPGYGYQPYPANTTAQASYNPTYGQPGYQQAGTTSTTVGSMQLSDEQIRASLLSAVEDKMRRRLRDIFQTSQAEMDALKKTQEDLQKGKQKLEEMLEKLESEQNEVDGNIALLREKDEEIKGVLEKMNGQEELDIDEAVMPSCPLYKQLLNAFAEEQATEDAIYYLGEALRKGVLDLDVFLKQVRNLSTKQFMLRALIHKCREKAGLPAL